ncbi:MAG: hypothetical protein Q8920_11220 [Bacillota bacterium]|nr:hypothetical protein [Bacillota bacterium]
MLDVRKKKKESVVVVLKLMEIVKSGNNQTDVLFTNVLNNIKFSSVVYVKSFRVNGLSIK